MVRARFVGTENVDYVSTFICVAPDSTAVAAVVPPERAGSPTIASATFDLLASAPPYTYRSSDVIFTVWADRQAVPPDDRPAQRTEFYAKPHACLRSSDLGKRFGWGLHADADGRLAAYPVRSAEYESLASGVGPDGSPVTVTRAMRSSR